MPHPNWTDRAIDQAEQDNLHFDQYCEVLGEIARTAETPLTIGIFGPWGSGKTSLMRLVAAALAGQAPAPLTVWFNAWKYDQEEALWRALVIQVLNVFRPVPPGPASPPTEARLTPEQEQLNTRLDDLEASLYRTVEREEIGGVTVDWDRLLKGSVMGLTHLSLSVLPGVGAVLGKMMEAAQQQISGQDLNTLFEAVQRERRKVYREHIRSVEQFQHEFEALVRAEVLERQRRLVVFIDDLDRCLPEKAIEVLEALKLFLDVPGCLFFLGADREVIQQGIRVKYKGFLLESDDPRATERRIPISGDNYLEKIVQLPFHLLPLDQERVEQFIAQSEVELPPGCADLFAAGLEANPRKVKRALNIFRLLSRLAKLRQGEGEFTVDDRPVTFKPQLLAKAVVIQSRYRDLYQDLLESPAFLPHLERHFRGELAARTLEAGAEGDEAAGEPARAAAEAPISPETAPEAGYQSWLEKYQHRRPLQRLLSRGEPFADLPPAEVKLYLYLTYTTDESSRPATADTIRERWWADLLSNDPAKIESAVAAIRYDEPATVTEFQERLASALEQRSGLSYTWSQYLSMSRALARLGDPRDFGEMVQIPPGDYRLGEEEKPQYLEGFKIAKYPVTNEQYQQFLADKAEHPPPAHWDQAGRTYPPELASHPVTHVSWQDAQAYCDWAKKRLPSAREWEAAARGPEGWPYPYGHQPSREGGNSSELELKGTTPAGVFPAGASPFGLLDLAGNVWEWTGTAAEGEGAEAYWLKGGSWQDAVETTRCAHRHREAATARLPTVGFRVAE